MNYRGRIYLVGYMGSGKTTMGRKLATMMNYHFTDLDQLIEKTYKTSIPLLFQNYDEHAFRLLEQEMLHITQSYEQTVISTGGGAPCFFDNMDFINRSGVSIYLKLTPEQLAERLKNAQKKRPLLQSLEDDELLDHIHKTLAKREEFYRQAKVIVDASFQEPDPILRAIENLP